MALQIELRRIVLAAGVFCGTALVACSLTTGFDGLTGSSAGAADARVDGRVPADSAVRDGGTTAIDDAGLDASEPFVVYVPAAGKYEYVQNAGAYADASDFDAAATDRGVDILTLYSGGGSPTIVRRTQAGVIPATVTYLDGGDGECWTLQMQILPSGSSGAHTEDETFCARDGSLLDPGVHSTVNYQTWNLPIVGQQSTTAVVDCSASNPYVIHGMVPGDSFMHQCSGTAAQTNGTYVSQGPYDYIGKETMTIDGTTEDVFHTLRTRLVVGATSGSEVTHFFLSTRDGLPLRIHRVTHIDTPVTTIGIDKVDYDEHGSDWLLSSHTPK